MCHKCYRNFLINLRKIVKCGICGHKQKLQFHHIKPTSLNGEGRGLWRRAKDIRDNPDCYIPLCFFCHKKVTSGEIFINNWGWKGRGMFYVLNKDDFPTGEIHVI